MTDIYEFVDKILLLTFLSTGVLLIVTPFFFAESIRISASLHQAFLFIEVDQQYISFENKNTFFLSHPFHTKKVF